MRILCKKSGIEFNCEHFPYYATASEIHHPIFDLPLPRLWKYHNKWQEGGLTKTDAFLYFLALLNATELVEFRCHVYQRPDTDRIVAVNMTNLYQIIGKIVTIKHPKFAVPRFVISPETRDLENVRYWIEAWEQAFEDFCNGLKDDDLRSRLQRKAEGLERLIKNPHLDPRRYARSLASWASEAGNFPDHTAEYWQEILIKCHTDMDIISIPEVDLDELIEHCEEHLDAGSIQGHMVFETLRAGMSTLKGFFSVGSPTFQMLGAEDDSVGKTNLQMLIDSAPVEEPQKHQYPTEFQYLKAKMKWQLAREAQK